MPDKITINIAEILQQPDSSITDAETVRQIALIGIDQSDKYSHNIKRRLASKVSICSQYKGLYPNILKSFDIKPEHYTK